MSNAQLTIKGSINLQDSDGVIETEKGMFVCYNLHSHDYEAWNLAVCKTMENPICGKLRCY